MSFLDGIAGSLISDVAQIGLGALTGGMSSLLTEALQGITGAIGNDVLQNVGKDLGLSQPQIEQAQSVFQNAAGLGGSPNQSIESAVNTAQSQLGLTNQGAGQVQNQAFNASQYLQQQVQQAQQSGDSSTTGTGGSGGKGGGGDFLVKLAEAMGKIIDNKINDMVSLGGQIDSAQSSGSSQTAQLSAEMQADGQEVGMLSNALNESIKSVGQAISSLASHSS